MTILKNQKTVESSFQSLFAKLKSNNNKIKKQPPKKIIKSNLLLKNLDNIREEKCKYRKFSCINITPNKNYNRIFLNSAKNKNTNINNNKKFKNNIENLSIYNLKDNDIVNKNKNIVINEENQLNDFELNILDYKKALKKDKRKFFKCYWSLLKQNHLILFAILPNKDYNLRTIKLSLSLFSFSLYFTINCFFFSDKSMHKIYIELGKYKILYQLPQMVYSLLISSLINYILKYISLSGKNIIIIKRISNLEKALKKAKEIEKCEKNKILIFYIISFFFYYFSGISFHAFALYI